MDDRSSNIDYEDCPDCAFELGSGVCSNCEDDGRYCDECEGTGYCSSCSASGRKPIDYTAIAESEGVHKLVPPEGS